MFSDCTASDPYSFLNFHIQILYFFLFWWRTKNIFTTDSVSEFYNVQVLCLAETLWPCLCVRTEAHLLRADRDWPFIFLQLPSVFGGCRFKVCKYELCLYLIIPLQQFTPLPFLKIVQNWLKAMLRKAYGVLTGCVAKWLFYPRTANYFGILSCGLWCYIDFNLESCVTSFCIDLQSYTSYYVFWVVVPSNVHGCLVNW